MSRRITQEITRRKLKRIYHRLSYYTGKRKDVENLQLQQEGDKRIQDPDEVAQQIVAHNRKHFSQAKGCYFSRKEFQQVVSPASDAFDKSNMKPLELDFLQELQEHDATPISAMVTPEDWKNKFKSWRESTRTSPSGLNLGHFKSLISIIYNIKSQTCEVDTYIQDAQQTLLDATLRIANLAIASEKPITR